LFRLPWIILSVAGEQSAMDPILLEADEVIVKPFEVMRLPELIREKMLARKPEPG
jgi:hypothetical protein